MGRSSEEFIARKIGKEFNRVKFSGPSVDRECRAVEEYLLHESPIRRGGNAAMIRMFSKNPTGPEIAAIRRIKQWALSLTRYRNQLQKRHPAKPSGYWAFFTDAFNYLAALPPPCFGRLRLHTYHIDGSTYQTMFFSSEDAYRICLKYIQDGLPVRYRLEAPQACGEYGHMIDGRLINDATLRWQKLIRSLHLAGVTDDLEQHRRPMFLEIGGGYGALAHQFVTLFPNALYVIVDLPETLLYSAAYLSLIHGPKRVRLVSPGESVGRNTPDNVSFVLVPNFALNVLRRLRFDLAINVMSFQEMTAGQIGRYLEFVSARAARFLSWNHDRNHMSGEMISVPDLIAEHFPSVSKLAAVEPGTILREALYRMDPDEKSAGQRPNLLVFGSGRAGISCAEDLRRTRRFNVAGWIDNDAQKQGRRISGMRVHPPARLLRRDWDYLFIASAFYPEIAAQLEKMGLREIVDFAVYEPYDYPPKIRRYDPLVRTLHDERAGRVLALPRKAVIPRAKTIKLFAADSRRG